MIKTRIGAWTRFYYNAQNKLAKISGAGFSYEFMYDSRSRRVGVKKNNEDCRWDLHYVHVCIGQMQNGTMRKFFVRGLVIAEGTGDVVAEWEDLQFTNYNLRFGAEGTTKARRHQEIYDLRVTNYDLGQREPPRHQGTKGFTIYDLRITM